MEEKRWRQIVIRVPLLVADPCMGWLSTTLETGVAAEQGGTHALLSVYLGTDSISSADVVKGLDQLIADTEVDAQAELVSDRWIAEEDWASAWRRYAQPIRVGERLLVLPSNHEPPEKDLIIIKIDPGMAFGSGSHVSTRIALELLEREVRPGMRVADVGCGSGILTVACALLGAASIAAVDVDPLAVESTERNMERNAIGEGVSVSVGSGVPPAPDGGFDLIVANITPPVIAGLLPDLPPALRPGGVFIGSGILEERLYEVTAPLETKTIETREGWCGVTCVSRPN